MKKLIVTLIAFVLAVAPALAILGVGDIVYDPTNYAEAVRHFVQMEKEYAQLVATYNMIYNQYQQMLWMARQNPVNMLLRYRALPTPWTPTNTTNTYGTNGGWMAAINNGLNVTGGYLNTIQRLSSYGPAFGNIPADQVSRVQSAFATVELTDGANQASMQTIGNIRGNAAQVETVIRNLEGDSLTSDPSMNTEIAVLNKINAATVIGLRNTQDTNKLLIALAEQQLVQAKRQRDAEASAIRNDAQFRSQARAALSGQAANASSAMLNWRMP